MHKIKNYIHENKIIFHYLESVLQQKENIQKSISLEIRILFLVKISLRTQANASSKLLQLAQNSHIL